MPRFAHVLAKIPCPRCGAELTEGGVLGFQWGYCSNPHGGAYLTYEVGDALIWRKDRRGGIPTWAYFRDGAANIGDPSYGDLVVRESEYQIRSCRKCHHPFRGLALKIDRGVIAEVRAYEADEEFPDCDIATREPNGRIRPRPEWDDAPMSNGNLP